MARVYYLASYYDAANRLTTTVNVGTNGGSAYTRPSSPPSASDTVLVTSYAYSAAGFLDTTTDPRGLVEKNYYDNLGRVTKTIEDYTDGTPTNNSNKTTEFTYDGNNNTLTVKADMPGGAYETTGYVYGVTTSTGSNLNSNDILSATQYPDKTTGNPSSSSQESYTVNALGDALTYTDRNGNVHTYSYDVLGRLTADAVTTLGSGVDGSIRRITVGYDTGDRPYLYTSYNASSGGSIVNQVQDAFNGLGQLTEEWQAHAGAVNTSTSPNVQYSYTLMSGGVNNSRLTGITYPNGRSLTYNYATGVDNTISRLTSISDGATTLESESYLGLDTVVIRSQPQPGTQLTYVKLTGESNGDAGDQYTGLDRFGRVVDQRWIITSTGTATARTQYGYDRDSNVLYSNSLVNSSFSELYHANGSGNGYDGLNQLTNFARGTLNGSNDTISSPTHSQSFSMDALGNWTNVTTDGNSQTRTANQQNEITSISGQTTPGYDGNGNTTTDQSGHTLIYDAWNRLIQVKNGATVLETYSYDALGRRITENPGTQRDLFWDSAWQLVEEDIAGAMADQYVWSPVYIDALVERDTPTQRMYVEQDANFNVVALVDTAGTVQERYIYDPYGSVTILASNWTTRGSSNYGWVFFFQGKRYDSATGLYASRERDYSPTLGRFIENDPLGFGGGDTNLYRSDGNSPTGSLDPSGLDVLEFGQDAPILKQAPTPPKPPRPWYDTGEFGGMVEGGSAGGGSGFFFGGALGTQAGPLAPIAIPVGGIIGAIIGGGLGTMEGYQKGKGKPGFFAGAEAEYDNGEVWMNGLWGLVAAGPAVEVVAGGEGAAIVASLKKPPKFPLGGQLAEAEAEAAASGLAPKPVGAPKAPPVPRPALPVPPKGPVFPENPAELDGILGVQGTPIPDGPTTPGRGKIVWKLKDGSKITYEQHPYDVGAPDFHTGPHYHVDSPQIDHGRFGPGDNIPCLPKGN